MPKEQNSLPVQQQAPMIQHLAEVNEQWAHQAERFLIPDKLMEFSDDEQRIRLHLQLVEGFLRLRQPEPFSDAQLARREHHLNVLKAYWQAGSFPQNTGHLQRQPYFVDIYGTACAVGHLLREDGQQALVDRVVREHNYSYLAEMPYQEIADWAKDNGFSPAELAWIQPGYVFHSFAGIGNNGGVDGVVNAMATSNDEEILYIAGSFSEIDGLAANNIAQWDGENWNTLNSGVTGEIYALETDDNGNLYVAGDFELNGSPGSFNIAMWNGQTWEGLQTGDMEGSVYALAYSNSVLYIGGDFNKVNGLSAANLAYYRSWTRSWSNIGYFDNQQLVGLFSTNGPVYALEAVEDFILVGGAYNETASLIAGNSAQKMTADNLAYWSIYSSNWAGVLSGGTPSINSLNYHDGVIYFGGDVAEENGFGNITGGLWSYYDTSTVKPYGDGMINGFFAGGSNLYVLGGFEYSDLMFLFWEVRSVAIIKGQRLEAVAQINGSVRAGVHYQGKDIIAGSFDDIHGQQINDIAVVRSVLNDVNDPILNDRLQVYHNGEGLQINYELDASQAQFRLYNVLGQLVSSKPLNGRIGQETLATAKLASGTYVYQVQAEGRQQSGKISIVQN